MEQQNIRKQNPTKTDKLDATTDAAYEIIDKEADARELKTARLRALRMNREAQQESKPVAARRPKRSASAA